VRIIAEVLEIDSDDLLGRLLTNPEVESLLNPIIESRLKEASCKNVNFKSLIYK